MMLTPTSFRGFRPPRRPRRIRRERCHTGRMDIRRAVPILTVADVAAAVAEYRQVLGLEVLMDLGWIATLGTAPGPSGGAAAQFSVISRDATAPVNPDLSLEVADVDAAHELAKVAGAEIVHPLCDEDWGVRRFFYRARDGQIVNVISHRA